MRIKKHRKAEHQVPRIEQRIKSSAHICPTTDHGLQSFGNIHFVYQEIRAIEERYNSSSEQQVTRDSVDNQKPLKGFSAKQITVLVLEFVAHRLQYE